jgi:hypothetical protein
MRLMPPEFDPFVVVVTLVTAAAAVASRGRQLSPAFRRWRLGVLLLAAGPGLLATARLLGAPTDVVRIASLVRVILVAPALWLMWRYRNALTTSPSGREQ